MCNGTTKKISQTFDGSLLPSLQTNKRSRDSVNDVALETLDWVHWYNHERLHSTNGYISPERGLAKHCFARVQHRELCS